MNMEAAVVARPKIEWDPLALDNQLCFSLYAAAHAVKKAYRPHLDALGLTYPQYLILLVLWTSDALKVSEIGQRLHLDSGTLTPILKRLEANGLIRRTRRLRDEREVEIALTNAGRELRGKALGVSAAIGERLGLDASDMTALRGRLSDLVVHLHTDD
jgi:DNA-binding MarR family transcriptional regulator